MIDTPTLRALLAAAERSTPGPWKSSLRNHLYVAPAIQKKASDEHAIALIYRRPSEPEERKHANAEFIAKADPTTVAALCRQLLDAAEACEKLTDAMRGATVKPLIPANELGRQDYAIMIEFGTDEADCAMAYRILGAMALTPQPEPKP